MKRKSKRFKSMFLSFIFIISMATVSLAANYTDPFELPELTGNLREDYIAVAKSQLGYTEADDGSSYFGAWADQTYRPWCSEFAAWCAEQAGIPDTVIPVARSTGGYRNFFVEAGRYFYLDGGIDGAKTEFMKDYADKDRYDIETISINDVEKGDIILTESNGNIKDGPDHTAIFLEYKNGKITAISGNSSDMVAISNYELGKIHAVCKPDFELNDIKEELTEITTEEYIGSSKINIIIGSNMITLDDNEYEMDAIPYIQSESNSTMVPLRFVALAIGGGNIEKADESTVVNWDAVTKTATIIANGNSINFTAGSNLMTVNGVSGTMDYGVKAEIKDGRMYIPFRALGEAMGVDVEWDAETRTAIYRIK